jgi:hypothetical protein
MRPTTLAAFPAALKAAGDTSTLDLPLKKFLGSSRPSQRAVRAVETVAMILRIDRVSGLCTAEAESLLTNRFSPEIALQVREAMWDWLRSQAALPGPRLADAASGSNEIEEEEDDDDDDDDDYDGDDDDVPAPFIGHDPVSPIGVHGLRPASQPRESLPAVEAPPQDGDALDRWADRYGVQERLADRLDLEHVHHSYYGFTIEGLPATIRDGGAGDPGRNQGPAILSFYPGFPARGHGQIAPAPRGAGGGHEYRPFKRPFSFTESHPQCPIT